MGHWFFQYGNSYRKVIQVTFPTLKKCFSASVKTLTHNRSRFYKDNQNLWQLKDTFQTFRSSGYFACDFNSPPSHSSTANGHSALEVLHFVLIRKKSWVASILLCKKKKHQAVSPRALQGITEIQPINVLSDIHDPYSKENGSPLIWIWVSEVMLALHSPSIPSLHHL